MKANSRTSSLWLVLGSQWLQEYLIFGLLVVMSGCIPDGNRHWIIWQPAEVQSSPSRSCVWARVCAPQYSPEVSSYFRTNPKPFYMLAKELYPGNFKATKVHHFIRLLHDKGVLLRAFTQNIDTLEVIANIPDEKLVFAHGSFASARCIECKEVHDEKEVKGRVWVRWSWPYAEKVFADEIPMCKSCKGLVKPDIVFFGENLPSRFFQLVKEVTDKD